METNMTIETYYAKLNQMGYRRTKELFFDEQIKEAEKRAEEDYEFDRMK